MHFTFLFSVTGWWLVHSLGLETVDGKMKNSELVYSFRYGVVPNDYITFTCKNKTTACFWKCSSHPMLGNSSLATIFQLCKLKLHIICQMRQVPTSPGFPGCSWRQSDSSKRIVEPASKRKKRECKQLLILRFWSSTKVTKCIYSLSKNLHAKRVKTQCCFREFQGNA